MEFVLDASAALSWFFGDEANPGTQYLLELANAGSTLHVPEQWPLEILNGLTRAARRGRIENRDVNRFLHALLDYRIVVSQSAVPLQWSEAMSLIASHRLSAYDAAYLALAKRLQVGLATFDQQLRMAALAEHLTLIV